MNSGPMSLRCLDVSPILNRMLLVRPPISSRRSDRDSSSSDAAYGSQNPSVSRIPFRSETAFEHSRSFLC